MWERKVAGLKYILDQLLQAPEVPKWEHLGQQICLNSTPNLDLELALKKMARAGVDISSDSVSVITSALTIRNIDPSSGHFFLVVNFGYSWGRYFG